MCQKRKGAFLGSLIKLHLKWERLIRQFVHHVANMERGE